MAGRPLRRARMNPTRERAIASVWNGLMDQIHPEDKYPNYGIDTLAVAIYKLDHGQEPLFTGGGDMGEPMDSWYEQAYDEAVLRHPRIKNYRP